MTETLQPGLCHASCVAVSGQGVLILGSSGMGKSTLAMDIISRGGVLVADDQVEIEVVEGTAIARCPTTLAGKIEARGIGLLSCPYLDQVPLRLVVDLSKREAKRLPPFRKITIGGAELELIFAKDRINLAALLITYVKGTRLA